MCEAAAVFSFMSFVCTSVMAWVVYERVPWLTKNPAIREPDEPYDEPPSSIGTKVVKPWRTR